MLKSIWLEGKRNWWIDHLICTLTQNMLPEHYEPRHIAQQIGFERPDLAEKHCNLVLENAKTILIESIKCVSDTQFHVMSQFNLDRCYLVDIQKMICDCLDFPRIWLCKHLCAVKIWYPFIPPVNDLDQDLPRLSPISSQMAATSTVLSEKASHLSNPMSGTLSGALPNRDCLSPNQNLWAATSKMMGVKTLPKRRQARTVAAVPSSTSQHIGPIGIKRKLLFTDAYNGREQSGKRAKPDAVSAAANAHARGIAPQ